MAAIYSNGGNCWNILGFNFTKRDALSSVYKISMVFSGQCSGFLPQGKLTGCVRINAVKKVISQLL